MPGKSCCSLLPDETVGLRNSMPNRSPLLPRPWSRMKVCVCWEDGGITRGSGLASFIILALIFCPAWFRALLTAVAIIPQRTVLWICTGWVRKASSLRRGGYIRQVSAPTHPTSANVKRSLSSSLQRHQSTLTLFFTISFSSGNVKWLQQMTEERNGRGGETERIRNQAHTGEQGSLDIEPQSSNRENPVSMNNERKQRRSTAMTSCKLYREEY